MFMTPLFLQVPELFYLPEVLANENLLNFGTTQLGDKLGMSFFFHGFTSESMF